MHKFILLTLASLASAQVNTHDPFYCFATDQQRPQRQLFSWTTHYNDVRGDFLQLPLSTCTPRRSWIMSRGGMRLPSSGSINTMRNRANPIQTRVTEAIETGRSQLCRGDVDLALQWSFNSTITNDRANELLPAGFNELRGLAQRLQRAFPQVFPSTYVQSQYRFRHTYRDRTADSARAFADGLFGHSNIVMDNIPDEDLLLRPIDSCPAFNELSSNFVERNAFRQGVDFQGMLEQVNRKLGLRGSDMLSTPDVITLGDYCRYESFWEENGISPWCGAFSLANHQVLEYNVDLQTYYTSGYGGDEALFSNINCHAIQDLLTFIQSDRPDEHLTRLFIGHGNIISLFLVSLGAFRDEIPPTRHNFAQQFDRQWRSSVNSPMTRNFVMVQHECAGDNDLVFFFNERPLTIPGCEAAGVCKQSTFLRLFQRFANANCDQLFCSRD